MAATSTPMAGRSHSEPGLRHAAQSGLDVMLTDAVFEGGGVGRLLKPRAAGRTIAGLARHPRRAAHDAAGFGLELARVTAGRSNARPAKGDRRFGDRAWQDNWLFQRMMQAYLATGDTVDRLISDAERDWRTERQARFAASNVLDALAPTNFPWSNPAVLKESIDAGGANFIRGGRRFLDDVTRSPCLPASVDVSKFEVGGNLAITPGSVVLRTDVFELIQYRPVTEQVYEVPLLFVPPTINKYYILDLSPGRSMAEWLLGQQQQARMGTAGAFASRELAAAAVAESARRGYIDGRALEGVFAWLRPNDLVWNYLVNNYLLGKDPPAFDILYWNQDTVRLAAGLHRDFVRIALGNGLAVPGEVEVLGTSIDLGTITRDCYTIAGLNDHIVPWENAYRSAQLLGGSRRFVLSTSGHIQALVNPPSAESRASCRVTDDPERDADEWVQAADVRRGSWWPDYQDWLTRRAGELKPAPKTLGSRKHKAMAKAPGNYVHAS